MIEKHFILPDAIDTTLFYGINNSNMRLIKDLHPTMRIMARGNIVKMVGTAQDVAKMENDLKALADYCVSTNTLDEEHIIAILKEDKPLPQLPEEVIVHGVGGRIITARTANQQLLAKSFSTHDLMFAVGPAGSGKTYMAIALAVKALKTREVRRIILSRPAVEAGEKLGFLPGRSEERRVGKECRR